MVSKGCVTVGSILAALSAGTSRPAACCGLLVSPAIKLRRSWLALVKGILPEELNSPAMWPVAYKARNCGQTDAKSGDYIICQQCIPQFGGLAGSYSTINFIQAAGFARPT